MAISDSLAMSSPYGRPAIKPGDDWRARVRERGNTIEPCPTCGGEAEAEPPVDYTRAGERLLATVHRCPTCGPVTQSQAAPPEPVREEPVMSETTAPECRCGCGEPVTRNARSDKFNLYASLNCSKRANNAKRPTTQARLPRLPRPAPVNASTPPASVLGVVKAYLHKLTPEARATLLDLVALEERAAALGVQ